MKLEITTFLKDCSLNAMILLLVGMSSNVYATSDQFGEKVKDDAGGYYQGVLQNSSKFNMELKYEINNNSVVSIDSGSYWDPLDPTRTRVELISEPSNPKGGNFLLKNKIRNIELEISFDKNNVSAVGKVSDLNKHETQSFKIKKIFKYRKTIFVSNNADSMDEQFKKSVSEIWEPVLPFKVPQRNLDPTYNAKDCGLSSCQYIVEVLDYQPNLLTLSEEETSFMAGSPHGDDRVGYFQYQINGTSISPLPYARFINTSEQCIKKISLKIFNDLKFHQIPWANELINNSIPSAYGREGGFLITDTGVTYKVENEESNSAWDVHILKQDLDKCVITLP